MTLARKCNSFANISIRGMDERPKYNDLNEERTGSLRDRTACWPLSSVRFPDSDALHSVDVTTHDIHSRPKPGRPPKSSNTTDKSRAVDPTDNDVLLRHVDFADTQPGNIKFIKKALEYRHWYENVRSKNEKNGIINLLIESVLSQGHQFLTKNSDGLWREAARGYVRKKAKQALKGKPKPSSLADGEGANVLSQAPTSLAETSLRQDKAMKKLARAVVISESKVQRLEAQLMEQSIKTKPESQVQYLEAWLKKQSLEIKSKSQVHRLESQLKKQSLEYERKIKEAHKSESRAQRLETQLKKQSLEYKCKVKEAQKSETEVRRLEAQMKKQSLEYEAKIKELQYKVSASALAKAAGSNAINQSPARAESVYLTLMEEELRKAEELIDLLENRNDNLIIAINKTKNRILLELAEANVQVVNKLFLETLHMEMGKMSCQRADNLS